MDLGFVGLGAMGAGMVPRLLAAGHRVTGWNRTKEKAGALIEQGMRWAGGFTKYRSIAGCRVCCLSMQAGFCW